MAGKAIFMPSASQSTPTLAPPTAPIEALASRDTGGSLVDVSGLRRADFEFHLPAELIAQHPAPGRDQARLLQVRADGLADGRIPDLVDAIGEGDVLVVNDTRVIKARLLGEKGSGGRVEALVERALDARRALALVRTSHAPRPGTRLHFFAQPAGPGAPAGARYGATVRGRHEDFFE